MNRKWIALGATMTAAVLVLGTLSFADDEKATPLHKLMEQVQKHNAVVLKGVRNEASYKKSLEEVKKATAELLKQAKEADDLGKEVAEAHKKTVEDWKKANKPWIDKTKEFGDLIAKPETTQAAAKESFKAVTKSCSDCHEVFRVEKTDKF